MTPDLLLRGGTLLRPEPKITQTADLLIRGGTIAAIGEDLEVEDDVPVYDASGKFISPGWMDMHVHFRQPGYEHRETIVTGSRAALAGGFTDVACMPNTAPPIHTRDVVEFVRERAEATPVGVHPIACVSKERARGCTPTGVASARSRTNSTTSRVWMGGSVFGMQATSVNPPARAARLPVAMV